MKEAGAIADPRVQRLLAEATAWRLLGLLLERPRENWWQEVEMLSRKIPDPVIKAAGDAAQEEAKEGLYLALLGPGGPVSAREVAYRGMDDPGRILADISAFYDAFAFQPETEEAPDHLSVEAGFLGYLCLKEAYALARGNDQEAEVAAQAAHRFRESHLAIFAWPVADRLEEAGVRYLSFAASALAHRSAPRRDTAPTIPAPRATCDECSMECGEG
ncbi:MAG TPA: molecular chaperone TorD family protein [Candidatus Methylomirabilis sp.]|nr:molecular chaperone TorD family protein [Candidatus Methylomirabilis sp.]